VAFIGTGQTGLHMVLIAVLIFREHSSLTHVTSTDTRTGEQHKSAKSMRDEMNLRYRQKTILFWNVTGTCLVEICRRASEKSKKLPPSSTKFQDCTSG
jgi:hypothetical protein